MNKETQVAAVLPVGQMFTIDWIRLEDGTKVSINGKLYRSTSDLPYTWLTKKNELRVIMLGSKVTVRTDNNNTSRKNESINPDTGMGYWTVPLSNVTEVVANGMVYYFDANRLVSDWVNR